VRLPAHWACVGSPWAIFDAKTLAPPIRHIIKVEVHHDDVPHALYGAPRHAYFGGHFVQRQAFNAFGQGAHQAKCAIKVFHTVGHRRIG
jgi:hypothetical protein